MHQTQECLERVEMVARNLAVYFPEEVQADLAVPADVVDAQEDALADVQVVLDAQVVQVVLASVTDAEGVVAIVIITAVADVTMLV